MRVFQINDDAGHTITNYDEVVAKFIAFYEQLLGGTRNSRTLDLTQYRPWASRILSHEDGVRLTRPVSVEEIKLVFFDIVEDKSLGPDGYTAAFYKAACPIIGDLRKAYDTVEWDFLFATMRLFGFLEVFIQWLEECVTTPTFSVCINGSTHGFFKGARGLRQGYPMSPYLFVLIMEVLHIILQQMIEQILLLFCVAHDPSIAVFQRGLELFATLSGLHVNLAKSQLILSKAARHDSTQFLATLGFQEGQLPVKYLKLQLISSRLSLVNCRPLLNKINSRIQGWGGISLSFAAQVQLIKSVLMALNTYWAMAFILPKDEGGLGVRDFQSLNLALMSRRLWEVDSLGLLGIGWLELTEQQRDDRILGLKRVLECTGNTVITILTRDRFYLGTHHPRYILRLHKTRLMITMPHDTVTTRHIQDVVHVTTLIFKPED
ncbi:hypothetical protein Sango_0822100 [Sesamum angolense]|uniref:Reverse transcriptase domain-containing protein n=1 Tax=Sesamum angolense TaxID=2727404 RepID=A0AAE1X3G2_9LAMI|nr:hypothetical protein Sango_0822100 [Sesamum angolense]